MDQMILLPESCDSLHDINMIFFKESNDSCMWVTGHLHLGHLTHFGVPFVCSKGVALILLTGSGDSITRIRWHPSQCSQGVTLILITGSGDSITRIRWHPSQCSQGVTLILITGSGDSITRIRWHPSQCSQGVTLIPITGSGDSITRIRSYLFPYKIGTQNRINEPFVVMLTPSWKIYRHRCRTPLNLRRITLKTSMLTFIKNIYCIAVILCV